MKLKNKEFDLLGIKYKLVYVDSLESEEGIFMFGKTNTATHEIHISKKDYKGNPISQNELHITLIHELIHAVLDEGRYNAQSLDEPMVEWIARCFKSLMDLKVI